MPFLLFTEKMRASGVSGQSKYEKSEIEEYSQENGTCLLATRSNKVIRYVFRLFPLKADYKSNDCMAK